MILHVESKDGRCFTYAVAWVTFNAFYKIDNIGLIAIAVVRSHDYVVSLYFQTGLGIHYFANLASGFHAFFMPVNIYIYYHFH